MIGRFTQTLDQIFAELVHQDPWLQTSAAGRMKLGVTAKLMGLVHIAE
jgi:hypothetical protein